MRKTVGKLQNAAFILETERLLSVSTRNTQVTKAWAKRRLNRAERRKARVSILKELSEEERGLSIAEKTWQALEPPKAIQLIKEWPEHNQPFDLYPYDNDPYYEDYSYEQWHGETIGGY